MADHKPESENPILSADDPLAAISAAKKRLAEMAAEKTAPRLNDLAVELDDIAVRLVAELARVASSVRSEHAQEAQVSHSGPEE